VFDQNFIKELWDLWKMSRGATPLLSTICTAQYICASDQEEASTKLSKCCGLLAQELATSIVKALLNCQPSPVMERLFSNRSASIPSWSCSHPQSQ